MNPTTPSLFGISKSNRNFADPYYWGKNQFNSAFPVALACYMRSRNLPLMYVRYHDEKSTVVTDIGVDQVFGTSLANAELYFSFETRFEPFRHFVHDELPAIDLVVCDGAREKHVKSLEIKLTTLPDNTTEALSEDLYGAELVIRSATSRYMALSMAQSVDAQRKRVREIFEPAFAKVRNWDSKPEMLEIASEALIALEKFLNEFSKLQTPLLMQPIWKTVGKSPVLANHCLDIFVWSDFALAHLFLDSARSAARGTVISRQLRAALRLSRFIYERSRNDKVFQAPIYDGMTYDYQNDKEFSIAGTKTRHLMACQRLTQPIIAKDEIKNIILGGGQKHLSPERRFDAILYFSNELFEGA
jgi:HindVP restriction endonuclease